MFFDTNVLLFALLDKGESGKDANELLGLVQSGDIAAEITPMVLDEVMWVLKKAIGRDQTDRVLDGVMAMPFTWLDITFQCIPHARARFMEGLDPRDAFHAAAMDRSGIEVIVSEDVHFNRAKGIRRKTIKEAIAGG